MTLLTFIFNISVVPYGNSKAFDGFNDGLKHEQVKDNITYSEFNNRERLKTLFFAKKYKFKDDSMNDITIVDFSNENEKNLLIAKKGFWNNSKKSITLIDGSISTMNSDINTNRYQEKNNNNLTIQTHINILDSFV